MHITVCLTPRDLIPDALGQSTAVVIDVLRMTSTAVTALTHGCMGILPVTEVDEARACAARMPDALLCGERKGLPLPDFALGNSPLAYTRARVAGKRVICTTTNGTRVLGMAAPARRVLLGSLLNAGAVASATRGEERLTLICAGTHDALSLEDVLAAGAIVERLQKLGARPALDDAAVCALWLYERARGDLFAALRETTHCAYLLSLGQPAYEADVHYCLCEDVFALVPELRGGWILPALPQA